VAPGACDPNQDARPLQHAVHGTGRSVAQLQATVVHRKVDPRSNRCGVRRAAPPSPPTPGPSPEGSRRPRCRRWRTSVRPDLGERPVAAEPIFYGSLHLGEGKHHLLVSQLTQQLQQRVGGGAAHVGDGLGRGLLRYGEMGHAGAATSARIRWPMPARGTRRPPAGSSAPQRPARSVHVERSGRTHGR
jgi:hypothetical protein